MRATTISLSALIAALWIGAGGTVFANDVGAVLTVKRDAYGTPRNAARDAKTVGDPISDHELLETDARSRLTVRLADGSEMSLGARSKALVDSFNFSPGPAGSDATGNALITVLLGNLHYATGMMPEGMTRIATPSAEVTLEGEIKVRVNARGYTHIDVEQGSIKVRSKYTGETTEVGAGGSISILPEGIREGPASIDRPATFGSVENRRNDHGGTRGGGGPDGGSGGDSGGDSGGGSDGGSDSGGASGG